MFKSIEEIIDLINKKVQESISIAQQELNFIFPPIILTYELKGVTAGMAYWKEMKLNFNLKMAELNLDNFLKQVIPHEVAHLVDFIIYKNFGHGKT